MLYVANCTKQIWMLNFRAPEANKVAIYKIHSGQQENIGKGYSKAAIDHIISHLERYGARDNSDSKYNPDEFDGYLYSRTKPIHEDKIADAHEVVVDKQEKRSVKEAHRSAMGFERGTRDKKTGKRLASLTEIEVKQDLPPRENPKGDEVAFKVTVDKSAGEDPNYKG